MSVKDSEFLKEQNHQAGGAEGFQPNQLPATTKRFFLPCKTHTAKAILIYHSGLEPMQSLIQASGVLGPA